MNQILQYLDRDNIKSLILCNKKIYQLYCNLVKKIKIDKKDDTLNLQIIIDKYENINNLDISYCKNIKDFTPISKLERLEILDLSETDIFAISFIEKNKNIKELNLYSCYNIVDFILYLN